MARIRYATISDIRSLIPLYSQLGKPAPRPLGAKSLKLLLRAPNKKILVAEDDSGGLLGLLEFTVSRSSHSKQASPVVYFDYVVVDTAFRRHRVGTALFEHAIMEYRAKGCADFYSETLVANKAAQAFHKQLGFNPIETVVRFHLSRATRHGED